MSGAWRKIEDENGFPFYVNEASKAKQWDHPKFFEIKQSVDECNYVKYSKYRVAMKFQVLQRAFYMEEISLGTIIGVFEKHRLGANESSLCLESYDLEAVLSDIYFAANKQNHTNIDVDFAVELMQNLLYNVFDMDRQGKIQVASTKLVLAILSRCELASFYNFVFTLCADHNNCVTRLRLQALLARMVEISVFMHEDVSFGQHLVNSTMEDCFSNSPGLVGISESTFISWLFEAPQLFSWVPILHRLRSAELVIHPSKCSTCKTTPLMGLRYRCIKCLRFTQCQRCFFTGRISSSHKLSHSMREYSTEKSSKEYSFNFMKKLCKMLRCSIKLNASSVSIIEPKSQGSNSSDKDLLIRSSEESFCCSLDTPVAPHTQLQLVIKQLELQNRDLHRILLLGNRNEREMREYLEDHKSQIAHQIQKLKTIKDFLNADLVARPTFPRNAVESTPMVGQANFPRKRNELEMLSPIFQVPEHDESEQRRPSGTYDLRSVEYMQPSLPYSMADISTWIKDQPNAYKTGPEMPSSRTDHPKGAPVARKSPVAEFHNDLDDALAKLQQILANNFTLDESLGAVDNSHLKHAVSEVEGMLTSFIDTVETSRASSVQPFK